MRTLSNATKALPVIETWSRETEDAACQETRNASAGAPHYVALDGRVQCVTRRCAEELMKHRKICGSIPARDPGNGEINHATLKAAAFGQTVGVTFQLKNLGDESWMLYCPEMRCEYSTKNPAREMMIITAEFMTLLEADYGELEHHGVTIPADKATAS